MRLQYCAVMMIAIIQAVHVASSFVLRHHSSIHHKMDSIHTIKKKIHRDGQILFGMVQRDADPNSDNEPDKAIEAARKQLEAMLPTTDTDEPPLLSTTARERHLAEISLLQALQDGDDAALPGLWNGWYQERGPTVARELRQIEELFDQRSEWDQAEGRLLAMVEEHGKSFVEPMNRLATLYFIQGKFEDSKKWCEIVLEHKPWHVGALSGIVMVCANLNAVNDAKRWAQLMLPSAPDDRYRWTERAIKQAKGQLQTQEERLQKSFGKMEDEPDESGEDSGAWQ